VVVVSCVQLWAPPTPPQDDSDLYIDTTQWFVYDTSTVMSDSQLPPVYVRKGHKRHRIDSFSMSLSALSRLYDLGACVIQTCRSMLLLY